MFAVVVQITALEPVQDHVVEDAVEDVRVVQAGVQRPALLAAPAGVPVIVQEAVLAAAQVDVPEAARVLVRMHVRAVQEDVWVIVLELAQELVRALVPLHAQDGTIINLGY